MGLRATQTRELNLELKTRKITNRLRAWIRKTPYPTVALAGEDPRRMASSFNASLACHPLDIKIKGCFFVSLSSVGLEKKSSNRDSTQIVWTNTPSFQMFVTLNN